MRAIPVPSGVSGLGEVFGRCLDVLGADRLLFGSDSNVFPRGYAVTVLEQQVATLVELGVTEEDQTRILGGNLARLLGGD